MSLPPTPARPSRWYRLAVASGVAGAWVAARFNSKLARGLDGRRGLAARYADWACRHRDTRRPLVWFHAPSVGEGLQVQPVLDALREDHPDWQLAFTYFSPSAERLARSLPVDFADYLPLDRPQAMANALDTLGPSALVFGKLDVWPELALAATSRRVRLALISATVSPGSSRLAWPARRWTAPAYAALDQIGAVSQGDADRLARLGARPETIRITGDTRYDSVAQRAARLDRAAQPFAALEASGAGAFTIVAGSTWPSDERVVLPAFAELAARAEGRVRLVIAPHEPTAPHLQGITDAARRLRLPVPVPLSRFDGAPGSTPSAILLIDRVGVLAELYALATVAFVGGGYHRAGLHSVLEPAVFGIPVCFGPRWENSGDAAVLIRRGAATALPGDGRTALTAQWVHWHDDPTARQRAGAAAAAVVKEGAGATTRTLTLLRALLPS